MRGQSCFKSPVIKTLYFRVVNDELDFILFFFFFILDLDESVIYVIVIVTQLCDIEKVVEDSRTMLWQPLDTKSNDNTNSKALS